MVPTASARIVPAAVAYWRECVGRSGVVRGSREFVGALWEFLRDSTPSRLRSRFGDADYDWDYRVNTTSGAVGWRDRLLGVFHSAYQPTEHAAFGEMMAALAQQGRVDFREFTFIDLGSGKGRTLLMASDYPFRRALGVELLSSLNDIANKNLAQYQNESQKCFALESICADATTFTLPGGPLVIYLFNPFGESGVRRVLATLENSLDEDPRPVCVVYHNPQHESVLIKSGRLMRLLGTDQYSIFTSVV